MLSVQDASGHSGAHNHTRRADGRDWRWQDICASCCRHHQSVRTLLTMSPFRRAAPMLLGAHCIPQGGASLDYACITKHVVSRASHHHWSQSPLAKVMGSEGGCLRRQAIESIVAASDRVCSRGVFSRPLQSAHCV